MDERLYSDVRVWRSDGRFPVGVGFLCGPNYVMTCAHVVADALGDRRIASDPSLPGGEVSIDFPALAEGNSGVCSKAHVYDWRPMAAGGVPDDVAILRVVHPIPEGLRPVRMSTDYRTGDEITAFGVRAGLPAGAFFHGRLLGDLSRVRLQVVSADNDTALRPGCSGGAAWSDARGGVVGMVVEAMLERAGSLIPIDVLAKYYFETTGERIAQNKSVAPLVAEVETIFDNLIDDATRLELIRGVAVGRAIDPLDIKLSIKRAFAEGADPLMALEIIGDASQLVLDAMGTKPANKFAFVLSLAGLRNPESSRPLDFWSDALSQACMLGPRMLAALLLVAPAGVVNRAKSDFIQLFIKLEAAR
jgi:hypothetical protein